MEVDVKEAEKLHDVISSILDGVQVRMAAVVLHMVLADVLDADEEGFEENGVTTKMRQKGSGNWVVIRTQAKIQRYN